MITSSPLRIGVLGAATIVPMALTNPAKSVPEIQVLAIASRDPKQACRFAKKHHIPRVHQTYGALLADHDIDAIYNPLSVPTSGRFDFRGETTWDEVGRAR